MQFRGLPESTKKSLEEFCIAFGFICKNRLICELIGKYSLSIEQYSTLEMVLDAFPVPRHVTKEHTNRVRDTLLEMIRAIRSQIDIHIIQLNAMRTMCEHEPDSQNKNSKNEHKEVVKYALKKSSESSFSSGEGNSKTEPNFDLLEFDENIIINETMIFQNSNQLTVVNKYRVDKVIKKKKVN